MSKATAETGKHPSLVFPDGPRAGTVYPLLSKETLVGRIDSANLVFEDPTVSRLHARLKLDGDGVMLEDLQSREGTWVNGTAVKSPQRLVDGDSVAFGDVVLVYRSG